MSVLDKFSLAGRTALVTGGYRGLGLAFATGLAEAGADVVIGARDVAASKEAAARLAERTGRTVVGVGLDVNDLGQLAAEQRERPPDVHHPDRLVKTVENKDVGVQSQTARPARGRG